MKWSWCLLLLCVGAGLLAFHTVQTQKAFISSEQRQHLVAEAMAEAKAHTSSRSDRSKAAAQSLDKNTPTSLEILKLFKKASSKAVKIGTAQLQYEDMVRRMERKLSEQERMTVVGTQSAEANAAAIARELFHVPGSMLTKQELAHMWQESGCQDAREEPLCNKPTYAQFRTIDGTCNNLENPLFGAAQTAFRRLLPGHYEDGVSSLDGNLQARFGEVVRASPFSPPHPSGRYVSVNIVEDRPNEEMPFTHILMQWGQFLDHDLDLSPELEAECEECTFTDICQPIQVTPSDPAFGVGTQNNGSCLFFRRSLPVCPTDLPGSFSPREQLNDITSFIDASMVYGSNPELADALREFRGGWLRVGPNFPGSKPTLPTFDPETAEFVACPNNRDDCFLCGDARCNEQISLTIMHTVWLREHNRCAREMARINPHWEDERLYQECRKLVGALVQKITFKDYLPKVFGPSTFEKFVGPYKGYKENVDPGVPNGFATAAYRYGHSLIRPFFSRLDVGFNLHRLGPLNLRDAFFNPPQFNMSLGTDLIVRGLISENSLRMDEFLNSVLTTQLFQTANSPGFDLASLNLQRGRDHGLPPYLMWRNFCNRIFEEVSPFENLMTKLLFMNTYGSLDTVDLWIGGLAEGRLPESLLGATFACIFGLTFAGVRDGDRFYYEREGVFTPTQLQAIQQDSMSRVLCDNLDDLREVQPDAFLSNQTRISCDSIPRNDLSAFREEPCYFRVSMSPRNFATSVNALVRIDLLLFLFYTRSFPPSRQTLFECETIQCPTSTNPADVIVYSNEFRTTSVRSNSALPPNRFRGQGVYRATWDKMAFDAGKGGVFTSLSACESGSETALDFTASATSAEAQTDSSADGSLPKEILEIIKSGESAMSSSSSSSSSEEREKEAEAKMASDEALIQELEGALKNIRQ